MTSDIRSVHVAIVGGGVVGTAIAREFSKYALQVALFEKEPDLATGTTKANSAILHAGFDAAPGSLKAVLNVKGNHLFHQLEDELHLDIDWTGSLVAATTNEEMETLQELLVRGQANGVPGLEIISKEQVMEKEPNLSPNVIGALWAPTAGVCWPFGAAIAFAQCAEQNGAKIYTNCPVTEITKKEDETFTLTTPQGIFNAKYVINAAGIHAGEISQMAGDDSFTISPRKGEYLFFDKAMKSDLVQGVVFPAPSKISKGILVCTTTHGNTFVGPNAQNIDDLEETSTSPEGINEIINSARKLIPTLPLHATITQFSGLRAVSSTNDFVIGASPIVTGLYHAAGIQSPGLTAAPAIAEKLVDLVHAIVPFTKKENFIPPLPKKKVFHNLSQREQAQAIKENPLYGRVICRCEIVTEAEIVEAIQEPCGARTLDGVKRRTRAGMGRCQGGFCGPRITDILARELKIPVTQVRKEEENSILFYEKISDLSQEGHHE